MKNYTKAVEIAMTKVNHIEFVRDFYEDVYHFVILNVVRDLNTAATALQTLRSTRNGNAKGKSDEDFRTVEEGKLCTA